MQKRIEIYFTDPLMSMKDHKSDIMAALKHASHNLYSRHKIDMIIPIREIDNKVVIILDGDMDASFNIGNHLRGISMYLLKHCDYPYEQHKIGSRLLYYRDITANGKA